MAKGCRSFRKYGRREKLKIFFMKRAQYAYPIKARTMMSYKTTLGNGTKKGNKKQSAHVASWRQLFHCRSGAFNREMDVWSGIWIFGAVYSIFGPHHVRSYDRSFCPVFDTIYSNTCNRLSYCITASVTLTPYLYAQIWIFVIYWRRCASLKTYFCLFCLKKKRTAVEQRQI